MKSGRLLRFLLVTALAATAFVPGTAFAWGGQETVVPPTTDPAFAEPQEAPGPGEQAGTGEQGRLAQTATPPQAPSDFSAGKRAELGELVRERVRMRVVTALGARHGRFDNAIEAIRNRLERVSTLADKLEAAGGDVTEARALLAQASADLDEALRLEAEAAAQFEAIADAEDPFSAFHVARETARAAVRELISAQRNISSAIRVLAQEIGDLRGMPEGDDES
jgi:hypothetical protein